MADFEYAFASAGTPTSFPISGTSITGIDEAGTLTPKIVRLGGSATLLLTATKTDAELVALMSAFIQRYGAGHADAGGFPAQATLQETPAETSVAAAD
jgi:hypothetical protein